MSTDHLLISSELDRQKTIAENRALLDSLGLDPSGASKIPGASTPGTAPGSTAGDRTRGRAKPAASSKKRKLASEATASEGPRRRSGRIAGFEADGEELKVKIELEEKEREVLRVLSRKEREQEMNLGEMIEEPAEGEVGQMVSPKSHIVVR